jgi:hypothetical protein
MSEREIAELRLAGFCAEETRHLILFRRMYPNELTHRSLYSLATVISALANVPLERDYARRKELLAKGFDDHYEELERCMQFIELIGSAPISERKKNHEFEWPLIYQTFCERISIIE